MKSQNNQNHLNGVIRCTRYAFMPNRLNFCGPENQDDVLEFYANANKNLVKGSIEPLLMDFETMFPYLKFIARENGVKDPFNERVVDAYWLGNSLTSRITAKAYHKYLVTDFDMKKKVGDKIVRDLGDNFSKLSIPHHNFHALNIFRYTGKNKGILVVNVFDKCRISSAKIVKVEGEKLKVMRKMILVDEKDNLYETEPKEEEIKNSFEGVSLVSGLKKGDIISVHWGSVCEKISKSHQANLQKITNLCIEIFNSIN